MADIFDLYRNLFGQGGQPQQGPPQSYDAGSDTIPLSLDQTPVNDPYTGTALHQLMSKIGDIGTAIPGLVERAQLGGMNALGMRQENGDIYRSKLPVAPGLTALGDAATFASGGLASSLFPAAGAYREAARYGARELPGAVGGVLADEFGGIRAFHGSPHSFDKFDLSKIGTGEGAQAYGKGLYFAEHEPVSETYMGPDVTWRYGRQKAQTIYDRLYNQSNERGLSNEGWDKLNAQRGFWERVLTGQAPRGIIEDARINPDQFGANELRYIQSLDPNKIHRTGGHMYEVDIHADPKGLLDWDKPFSEQSPRVQEALNPTITRAAPMDPEGLAKHFLNTAYAQQFPEASDVRIVRRMLTEPSYPEELAEWAAKQNSTKSSAFNLVGPVGAEPKMSTGGQIYERLGSPDEAMDTLRQAGVPGIRYLDQGSRTVGQGTSNYVINDAGIVEILRKYGLLPPLAGGGLLATQQEQQ